MSIENCARHQEAHDAFNMRDMDACVAYMSDECEWIDCGRDMTLTGKAEIKGWLQGWVDMLDGNITERTYLDAGDYSVCMFTASGTGPAGAIDGPYCEILHWRDGKVDEANVYYDQLKLMVKLGMMEAPAVATV